MIKVHGFDLARQRGGSSPASEEVAADWDAAASYAAREGVGRRDRRVIESEAAKPLHRRPQPRA